MTGVLVALVLGLAPALTGFGLAHRWRRDPPGPALGTALGLAAIVVVCGDAGAVWGFRGWMPAIVWAALTLAAWLSAARRAGQGARFAVRLPAGEAAGLALLGLALAVPLWILPVPMDTDAQGFGYLALMIRDGGSLTSLAPWHPEIQSLYAPGALLLFAGLSRLFSFAPMSAVMMGASHAAVFLFVWLAWEFGDELGRQAVQADGREDDRSRWRWAAALSAGLSAGLWSALLDSHYTAIFGLLFALAAVTCLLRVQRTGRLLDSALAAVALAATVITHVDTALALALGFAAWLVFSPWAGARPRWRRWLLAAAVAPAAAVMVSPWLIRLWPLLEGGARSPFPVSLTHVRILVYHHGLIWPLLALVGAAIALRRRWSWALVMVGWLALAVEVSAFGMLERAFPVLEQSLLRFDYPFSLAWHAPIIPYLALGTAALVWLAQTPGGRAVARLARPLALVVAVLLVLIPVLSGPLLRLSRGRLGFYGAFATDNDVAVLRWLRDHTPADARILNYPGDYLDGRDWEAHWAPVIAERDCVYFRRQPFFLGPGGIPLEAATGYPEQLAFLAFWRDPADPVHRRLLRQARIQYVVVPESVGDPASADRAWRWQPPALLADGVSLPADAPYLALAFESGGAQVFRVLP